MEEFDLIIFDLDGTLYQTPAELDAIYPRACLNLARKHLGVDEDRAAAILAEQKRAVEARLGAPTTNSRALLESFPEISFEEFQAEVDRLADVEGLITYDPKARRAVKRVAGAHDVVLYTTSCSAVANRVLDQTKLSDLFPRERRFTLSSAGEFPVPRAQQMAYVKPGREGFRHLLERYGARPEKTLMVGDSENSDMAPARSLGMKTYRIHSAQSLYELPTWLEGAGDDPSDR